MALTPHLSSLNLLFFNFAVNGFASGGIESSADVWIVEMWQKDCGPYVQALHFVFGIGSIVTPLVVEPYLVEVVAKPDNELVVISNLGQNGTESLVVINNTAITTVLNDSQIITGLNTTLLEQTSPIGSEDMFISLVYIPYSFLSVIVAVCGLFLGSLFFYKRYVPPALPKTHQTSHNKTHNKTTRTSNKKPTIFQKLNNAFIEQLMPTKLILLLIVMCGYLMSVFLSLEWSQFNYFPSFAHFSGLHLSEKRAAIISTGLAIAFTAGRAIAIPVSHFVSPKLMIFCSLLILLVSEILFLFFSNNSEIFMWIANILFGLGLSPIYASIYHMVEEVTQSPI
ncbi:major facilitator superfamily domain-containing protein 4A-like [Oppia nitens]|uniref:major facilitator superfamily domain-containing protein 4A-like n=1 Tax=Oppia nitens TaxID=1686743 RepID=UPI0023DA8231|nr:major facilitator superfamily domain-containing protein 4A-like [Oppia nitens]